MADPVGDDAAVNVGDDDLFPPSSPENLAIAAKNAVGDGGDYGERRAPPESFLAAAGSKVVIEL